MHNGCNECDEFVGQLRCDYCDCFAVKHVRFMDSDEKLEESKRAKVDSHENVMQREATKMTEANEKEVLSSDHLEKDSFTLPQCLSLIILHKLNRTRSELAFIQIQSRSQVNKIHCI